MSDFEPKRASHSQPQPDHIRDETPSGLLLYIAVMVLGGGIAFVGLVMWLAITMGAW